jgi:glycosyltransferase involved in cell wall biosynthesis
MAECARKSSLFCDKRIDVIPNAIDTDIYKPFDKRTARDSLALPHDRKIILFGANQFMKDRNKGFHLLVQALDALAGTKLSKTVELVTFGSPESASSPRLGIRARYLGRVNDHVSLARIYSASDVFVMPSIQESLGYTVMEAMACGTPCVAFNQGGVPDLIDHQHNGYLATPFKPDDLAQGITWILENEDRGEKMSLHSRQKVEREFAVAKVAERHIVFYRELLKHK